MEYSELLNNIPNGLPIEITFYENDAEINKFIRQVIKYACEYYNKPEYSDVLYGCTKELVINATKANLKRIFFQANNWDINNMGHYATGLPKFKKILETNEYKNYIEDLKKQNLWVKFNFIHSPDGFIIQVINNSAICNVEEGRIRMKLKRAMKLNDLVQMYNEDIENSEGSGLGMALIVILMKSVKLDASLFRIGSKNEITTARIEIPFNKNFKTMRKIYKN